MKRRTHTVVAVLAVSAAATATTFTAGAAQADSQKRATNVIYMVGDGMGYTHVTAGRVRHAGARGSLAMETLQTDGHVSTWAVEEGSSKPALVTDSASSATAWSSGVKTYNAAIGVDAFGDPVPTIMEQAKAQGYRTGNVSTAEITDATPAAQMAHALLRGCQGPDYSAAACGEPAGQLVTTPIAEQIARNGVADVILGGGLSRFEPDDAEALQRNGYQVLGSFGDSALETQTAQSQRVATRTDLQATDAKRVIGLFNRGNLTVETAKRASAAGAPVRNEPTLAEMTTKAIALLRSGDSRPDDAKGFVLQVEGALIDKRSHANDASQTLGEIKAFDDAVRVARDFAARDGGRTLVVVTADHECAGFNIIEQGSFTNAESTTPPSNVDSGNTANNSTPSRPARPTRDAARSTGPVNGSGSTNPANFGPATFRTPDDPAGVVDGAPEASLWLSYLSGNHTGADVPVFASGPGAEQFDGRQDNTEHYRFMRSALRLR